MPVDYSEIPSPCFVLEENLLRSNLQLIRQVQDAADCKIIMALKAFSMYSVFPIVGEYLSGATASSLNEIKLINDFLGFKAHTYIPAYLEEEFEEVLQRSSHLTFNTLRQYYRYKSQVENWNIKNPEEYISVGIRVNPQYSEVEAEMYNPCVPGSRLGETRDKFGVTLPEGVEGIHFHTLCENGSETLERTLAALEEKFGDLLHQARWLNMGGGHLMTREGYEIDLLIRLVNAIREKYNLEVILEPGSAIAWRTGTLSTKVLDIMDSQGIQVAILNVSFAAHMPDTLEMPYKPRIEGAYHEPVAGKPTYRMGGMTCLAGDFLGDYSFEEPLEIGDQLIFEDMIHYTMVKTTTFNGVNLPSIGIWQKNDTFRLIKSFGYESFKDRLS